MKVEKTEVSKVAFKNCILQKDEFGEIWLFEDLGEKGTESNKLEDVIFSVFGDEPFNIVLQAKVEV